MDVMHEYFSNASSPPLQNRYNAPVSYVSYLNVNVNCCWTSMINWRTNTNSKFCEHDFQLKTACRLGLWDLCRYPYGDEVGGRRRLLIPRWKSCENNMLCTSPELVPFPYTTSNLTQLAQMWANWLRLVLASLWKRLPNRWQPPLKKTLLVILLQPKKILCLSLKILSYSSKAPNLFLL